MRFLPLLMLLVFISPAHATPVSKDTANQYFQNCKKQQDPRFSADIQELFLRLYRRAINKKFYT